MSTRDRQDDPVWETIVDVTRGVSAVTGALVRHPWLTFGALELALVAVLLGPTVAVVLVVLVVIGLGVWRWRWPVSFERLVTDRRARARRRHTYRRDWVEVVTATRLTVKRDDELVAPRLGFVVCDDCTDRLTIDLLTGQTPDDVADAADAIAHAFGVLACRVRTDRPGRVIVELTHRDALAELVPALPCGDAVDLRAVPVGVTETGEPWVLPVLGAHSLLVGMTGSGKSSIIWSLLRGLAAPIQAGAVRVTCLDPKGGMELADGVPLFDRFATSFGDIAEALDELVVVMQERADRLRGTTRALEPTVDEPLLLVVVDELATLTAYQPDRKLRDRITNALALLCTQGRAVGVCVIGAVQDPRKEVVSIRDLFPIKIALRLGNRAQVDMVLGDGARAAGARCDAIPTSTPGVGFVMVDGDPEPVRVRAAFVTDDDINAMAASYSRPAFSTDVVAISTPEGGSPS